MDYPGVGRGFTGNDWQQKWTDSNRLLYTAGAFNVWWAESHAGSVPAEVRNNADRMTECSQKMTYGQIQAIVQKYLDKNPEKLAPRVAHHHGLGL